MAKEATIAASDINVPFTADPEDLLAVKMECMLKLLGRNLGIDEVMAFCRRADRNNREKFKSVLSEYFALAS